MRGMVEAVTTTSEGLARLSAECAALAREAEDVLRRGRLHRSPAELVRRATELWARASEAYDELDFGFATLEERLSFGERARLAAIVTSAFEAKHAVRRAARDCQALARMARGNKE